MMRLPFLSPPFSKRPCLQMALVLAVLALPSGAAFARQTVLAAPVPAAAPPPQPGSSVQPSAIQSSSIQPQTPSTPSTPTLTPAAQQLRIAALLKSILATLTKNGAKNGAKSRAKPNVQDRAGQLTVQISQSETDCSITQAALRRAASTVLTREARSALQQVTIALSRCQIAGTAALPNAQTALGNGTALSVVGGTSNYVQP